METTTRLGPTLDRHPALDVLRGFALFGVLLVNFEWFNRAMPEIVLGPQPGLTGLDRAADFAIATLATGKFYALFSMLFGAGFALMLERATARGAPFWGTYLRRLATLAVIGALHVTLVWAGDILLTYAIVGFVMVLLFRRTPTPRLWKWALALVLLPAAMASLAGIGIGLAMTNPEVAAGIAAEMAKGRAELDAAIEASRKAYAFGTFAEVTAQRWRDWAFGASHFLFWVPPILGYFLLGRWLLVTGRLTDAASHGGWFARMRLVGIGLGLPLSAAGVWLMLGQNVMLPTPRVAAATALLSIGALLLSLGWLSCVVPAARALAWLAPAGRMALTHYLIQSLVWTFVFYGYGLGLWGEVPRALHPVLVVGFFALQVIASHWWLARFRFGPAEWAWRYATYGKAPPMRGAATAGA
jgi:uncharacterized protein